MNGSRVKRGFLSRACPCARVGAAKPEAAKAVESSVAERKSRRRVMAAKSSRLPVAAAWQSRFTGSRASVTTMSIRSLSDRAEGYVTELPYTPGYHEGLDPAFVTRRLHELGFAAPQIRQACELGFGRGINLAVHSVAGTASWWGNDLLHEHVEDLRTLTRGLTNRLQVSAETFADFFARNDLPFFDFIGLHGIWSWVSAENRKRILEFIDRRLRPGGVVYVSYNVLAGWQAVLPLREFLFRETQRPEIISRPLAERIELALQAAQAYVASEPPELANDPEFERHLRRIRPQHKAYLAHEYFNRDWAPVSFTEMANAMGSIGLVHAGQTTGGVVRAADFAAEEANDQRLRRSFRRDLWLRPSAAGTVSRDEARDAVGLTARIAATSVLNDRLLQMAIDEPHLSVVASPLTGGGIDLGWRGLLALSAWRTGLRRPADIAGKVAERMQALTQPLVHEDFVIRDAQEIAQILQREARVFCDTTVPRLRELLIEPAGGN